MLKKLKGQTTITLNLSSSLYYCRCSDEDINYWIVMNLPVLCFNCEHVSELQTTSWTPTGSHETARVQV